MSKFKFIICHINKPLMACRSRAFHFTYCN